MRTNMHITDVPVKTLFSILCILSMFSVYGQTGGGIFETGPLMNRTRIVPFTAVLDDSRVVAFGGREYGFVSSYYADIYDPETNTFTERSMSIPRDAGCVAKMSDGRYLTIGGGYDWGIPAYANNEIFDPSDNTFELAGTMIYPRMQCSATEINDGNNTILIVGGWYNNDAATFPEYFNPAITGYSLTGALNVPRASAVVLPTSDGSAVVCGGWPSYGGEMIKTVEYLDMGTLTWSVLSDELIPEDPGWLVWGSFRPTADYKLSDGKYALLAYRNNLNPEYTILLFDPDSKTFERPMDIDIWESDYTNGGIYDIAVDKAGSFVYMLGFELETEPYVLGLISVDLNGGEVYYPEDGFELPYGEYLFPTLAYMPFNGKILLMGVSSSPSDYFNATDKTYLIKPDYTVGIEENIPATASEIIVFPDPATDHFSFVLQNALPDQFVISIADMPGRIIYSEIRQENNTGTIVWQFNDVGIPGGIYQIKVYGSHSQGAGSLVIAR